MTELDDQLRTVLRREEPPDGFVERVLRRVEQNVSQQSPTSTPVGSGFSRIAAPTPVGSGFSQIAPLTPVGSVARWAAAVAVVAAVAGAGMQYRTAQMERARVERAQGEAARQQIVLALQIAGSKLHLVQTRINRLREQPEKSAIH